MLFISEGNCLSDTSILIILEGFLWVLEQTKPTEIKSTSKIIYPWQLKMHLYAMLFFIFQAESENE